MVKRENKKGAEFTITTLIVIILAIVVLVVLVLGFGTGWANLWGKVSSYFTTANVDSVKEGCKLACSTNGVYAYCNQQRDVVTINGDGTKNTDLKQQTCKMLEGKNLGFEGCPGMDCGSVAQAQDITYETMDAAKKSCTDAYTAPGIGPNQQTVICNTEKKYLLPPDSSGARAEKRLTCKLLATTLNCN